MNKIEESFKMGKDQSDASRTKIPAKTPPRPECEHYTVTMPPRTDLYFDDATFPVEPEGTLDKIKHKLAPDVESAPRKTETRTSAAPAAAPEAKPQPDALERHRRKCCVCNSSELEAIEEEFLHWRDPYYIAKYYEVPERSLHRHAHAMGLYSRRSGQLRFVLDRILEQAGHCTVSADSIIRAVRAYACLTDDNRWVEPATHVVFSRDDAAAAGNAMFPANLAQNGEPDKTAGLPSAGNSGPETAR
jgi:hypothetical protein